MFTRIQTSGYRCLKAIDQSLGSFAALVGPNASGKTTFLDVIAFMSDVMAMRGDVAAAVRERSSTFEKLLWRGEGDGFQLAVEALLPDEIRAGMGVDNRRFSHVRYELGVSLHDGEVGFDHESLMGQTCRG